MWILQTFIMTGWTYCKWIWTMMKLFEVNTGKHCVCILFFIVTEKYLTLLLTCPMFKCVKCLIIFGRQSFFCFCLKSWRQIICTICHSGPVYFLTIIPVTWSNSGKLSYGGFDNWLTYRLIWRHFYHSKSVSLKKQNKNKTKKQTRVVLYS